MSLMKRDAYAMESNTTAKGVGTGMIVAPAAAYVLSILPIIPGGLLFWLLVMVVLGLCMR